MKTHSAFSGIGYGTRGELLRTSPRLPQPRRRPNEINRLFPDHVGLPGPAQGKRYLLDTRLLMGGSSYSVAPRRTQRPIGIGNGRLGGRQSKVRNPKLQDISAFICAICGFPRGGGREIRYPKFEIRNPKWVGGWKFLRSIGDPPAMPGRLAKFDSSRSRPVNSKS